MLLDGAGLGGPELSGFASLDRMGARVDVDAGAVFETVGNTAENFSDAVRKSARSETAGSKERVP